MDTVSFWVSLDSYYRLCIWMKILLGCRERVMERRFDLERPITDVRQIPLAEALAEFARKQEEAERGDAGSAGDSHVPDRAAISKPASVKSKKPTKAQLAREEELKRNFDRIRIPRGSDPLPERELG